MKLFMVILWTFLFVACTQKSESAKSVFTIQGETMGTYYVIKLNENNVDTNRLQQDVEQKLKEFNQIFSTYIPTSEISELNKLKSGLKTTLSQDLNYLLEQSILIHHESGGAFDPTVGPLVNRWGFGPDKNQNKPTPREIQKLKAKVGLKLIHLRDNVYTKNIDDLYLDLSAIAKGYAVDKLLHYLKDEKGYQNILVEIGGEVRGQGRKGDAHWMIGIERPSEKLGGELQLVVPLLNRSIATSGSYRNYLKYGDEVFNHTIDPSTGMPVTHKLVSASVIHEDCATADAWATAFMVMGAEKALDIANRKRLMVYLLVKTDEGLKEFKSIAFEQYLNIFKRDK
jgi:FAD:protein FMN transferase